MKKAQLASVSALVAVFTAVFTIGFFIILLVEIITAKGA